MRKTHRGIGLLAVMALLLLPVAASAAEQEVDLQVLPEDTLSIDVESGIYLDPVVPGTSTGLAEFWMNITNTTAGGWDVDVSATDLLAYEGMECDDYGENCVRNLTPSVANIDASHIFVRGGDQDNWGDPDGPGAITPHEGYLTGAGVSFDLMEGTSVASGSFGLDHQRPGVQVDVPAEVGSVDLNEYTNYYTTLTYTITGST